MTGEETVHVKRNAGVENGAATAEVVSSHHVTGSSPPGHVPEGREMGLHEGPCTDAHSGVFGSSLQVVTAQRLSSSHG